MPNSFHAGLIEPLKALAIAAGEEILRIRQGGANARSKPDASPVTDADEAAERLILEGLAALTPEIPVIAEERVAAGDIPETGECFWLVDPLDGTREFIRGDGDFTVNIALIEARAPAMGVVYAPAKRRLFYGGAPEGAFEMTRGADGAWSKPRRIAVAVANPDGVRIVASKSHRNAETEAFIAKQRALSFVSAGSSLKFCLVAAGEADLYPRLGPTSEWDTAAGDAILRAAGGTMTTVEGEPFLYGKPDFKNGFFIARGRSALTP